MPAGRGIRPIRTSGAAFDVRLQPSSALLIRYDLSAIPDNMRVTKAEWLLPVDEHEPAETRLYVWSMLTSWGAGVCHNYRTMAPEKKLGMSLAGAGRVWIVPYSQAP